MADELALEDAPAAAAGAAAAARAAGDAAGQVGSGPSDGSDARGGPEEPKLSAHGAAAGGDGGDASEAPAQSVPASTVAPIANLYATVYAFNMFTITDGAIRVIVLLHANNLGFTALQIALMFTLYELAGVVTNLFGGIAGVRYGLKLTLFVSVVLQLVGLVLLLLINPIFGATDVSLPADKRTQVTVYITLCQMLSGISKDFMKISCKTVPKLVTSADENDRLFRLVAWVTGMKNSLKGFGHLLGAVLVEFAGFEVALAIMLAIVVLIVPVPAWWMDRHLGKGNKKTAKFSWAVFQKSANVNVLSLARFFLFGSRDVWFEIAAPIFLRSVLTWPEYAVGIFMGGYIILYGNVQTATGRLYKKRKPGLDGKPKSVNSCLAGCDGPPTEKHVPNWAFVNAAHLVAWGSVLFPIYREFVDSDGAERFRWSLAGVLIGGLIVFAFIFAVNSSVHSYLIVLYSGKDKAAMDLGFYYMANAMGRLVGTILSGAIYQATEEYFGLSVCLWTASGFMVLAGIVAWWLEPEPVLPK